MKAIKTPLDGCVIVEPEVFGDHRGWFYEMYSAKKFAELGIISAFVQDNRSFSEKKGTLRGLHCQINPKPQAKLITCLSGAILDVAVDIRQGSPSYMRWTSAELTAENNRMLFVPRGFLHGFITLADNTEVLYKVDEYFSQSHDRSVYFNDSVLSIDWRILDPILSDKDRNAPVLADSDVRFLYD